MVGTPSLVSTHSGAASPLEFNFSPVKDNFSLPKCVAHTARKARYKPLGNGLFVRTGWLSKTRTLIEGNNADSRYHRAVYESSQRISAALLCEQYRGQLAGKAIDLSDSPLVKARFYRQDNLRFNPQFRDPRFGLSSSDQRAVKLSRWAHYANGVTELGAAPTGMLLKISKILCTPNRDDKALGSQLRVLAALPVVAGIVSLFSRGVFSEGMYRAFNKVGQAIKADIQALAGSFSAISALSAMVSLTLEAFSCQSVSNSRLSPALTSLIQSNKDKHIHRIYLLLDDAKNKPGAVALLSKALQQKISAKYRVADGVPLMLSRLLEDVRGNSNEHLAKLAIEKTVGSYLTEISPNGETPGNLLNSQSDKAELLARENHFLALTNLIEHVAIHSEPHKNYMDLRHYIERGAEKLRQLVLGGSGGLLNVLGYSKTADKARYLGSQEYIDRRENDKSKSHLASTMYCSADNILKNAHQYGPLTRGLARLSEGLRVVNHGVLMSMNYQLTRPITSVSASLTESLLKKPNSRVTSFSIGRAIASSIWAAVDAFLILSLAAGQGVGLGGLEAAAKVKFPLIIPFGSIGLGVSIISTATQMLLVAVPAAILMSAARGACHIEGWRGNIARPLERAGSKRNPLPWA